jgi:conjugal transfer pilus assembly protein TrbC
MEKDFMRSLLAAVGLLLWLAALGGPEPSVTPGDIARARAAQPSITDADIERARRLNPMPTEEDLSKVPVPGATNAEALPQPPQPATIDLEALARGYQQQGGAIAAAQAMTNEPALLIFVSFSIPERNLRALVDQAARAGATLVLRGLDSGSLTTTVRRVSSLIGQQNVAIQIDPQAFTRFAVTTVPTFVLVQGGNTAQQCGANSCTAEAFVATAGDVSLGYALEHVQKRSPRFSAVARKYAALLRRG